MSLKAVLILEDFPVDSAQALLTAPENTALAWAWIAESLPPTPFLASTWIKPSLLGFSLHESAAYAQLVALIGVEPDEALLLAIHPHHRQAAQALGLRTSLNPADALPALEAAMIAPQWHGNLAALRYWLDHSTALQWAWRPSEEAWSGLQILSHLIESEEQHQRPRLLRILQADQPFIAAPMPPGPNQPVLHESGEALLALFTAARQQTLELLASLQPSDWQRSARHSIFGLTTLLEMAHFTAQHDRLHIQQLCQTLGHCQD